MSRMSEQHADLTDALAGALCMCEFLRELLYDALPKGATRNDATDALAMIEGHVNHVARNTVGLEVARERRDEMTHDNAS